MPGAIHEAAGPDWAAAGLHVEDEQLQIRILRGALGCRELGISIVRLKPGAKVTTGHAHPAGDEVYVLVSGRAELKAGDELVGLEPLSAVRVPGPTVRALRNAGDQDVVLGVASHPQDDPAQTVLVQDFWPAEPGETPVEARLRAR
jgi:uncharacterized cupin superfamily protein